MLQEWAVPLSTHVQCRAMGSPLDMMTSEDVRVLEHREDEVRGTGLIAWKEPAGREDQVSKSVFCIP